MHHFETMHTCCGYIEYNACEYLQGKNNFWQKLRHFGLRQFSVCPSVRHALRYRVCVINSSHSFQWIFLKPCILVVDILKMCMWVFGGARIFFLKIYSLLNLVILGNFLHCRVWSLCNQLLLQFSMHHFETMHTCCWYIEDVHVNFCRRKNNFWQNYGSLDLDNFQVMLQFGLGQFSG